MIKDGKSNFSIKTNRRLLEIKLKLKCFARLGNHTSNEYS